MKKNLISVIILALLIVNIVLTAIMMFSVTGASKKTAALVDNIGTRKKPFPWRTPRLIPLRII